MVLLDHGDRVCVLIAECSPSFLDARGTPISF
jgi:hypothetical protein